MSNTLTITGNLGGDPELRFTPGGDAVCSVSIADTPRRQNQSGEWEDAGPTLWISVSVWKEAAEALANAAARGDKVTATGRLTLRLYDRQDGTQGQSLELKNATVAIVPKVANTGNRQQPQQQGGGWNQPQQQQRQQPPAQSRPPAPQGQAAPAQQRPAPQQQTWNPGPGGDTYGEPPF